jgi:ribose 5-phosphate isomerase A
MEARINNIPGVLDNGLFVGMADEVLVGRVRGDEADVYSL